MNKKHFITELRAMDDKWITIGGESNPHKVLLDDDGNIKGGSIPKELHGASIEEGFKALKNTGERKSSPRKEGESPEDYKKRSMRERKERRKALAAELKEIMGKAEPAEAENKKPISKRPAPGVSPKAVKARKEAEARGRKPKPTVESVIKGLTQELESVKAQIKEAKEHYREGGYHTASLQSLYNKRDELVSKLKVMTKN